MLDHTQGKETAEDAVPEHKPGLGLKRPRRLAQHHICEEHAAHPYHGGKDMDRDEECHGRGYHITSHADVSFGSDVPRSPRHVRFTPESRHSLIRDPCPLSAISGHCRLTSSRRLTTAAARRGSI